MHIDTLTKIIDNLQRYFDELNTLDFTSESRKVRCIGSSRALISSLRTLLDDTTRSCPQRMMSNLDLVLSGEKDEIFFRTIIYPELEHLIYLCRNSPSVTIRGGYRERSGRPKGEGSKTIRVPTSLIEVVEHLIKVHKSKNEDVSDKFDFSLIDTYVSIKSSEKRVRKE